MKQSDISKLLATLTEVADFLDDQADAEAIGDPGAYVPNRAMRLQQEVEETIEFWRKYEIKIDAPEFVKIDCLPIVDVNEADELLKHISKHVHSSVDQGATMIIESSRGVSLIPRDSGQPIEEYTYSKDEAITIKLRNLKSKIQ